MRVVEHLFGKFLMPKGRVVCWFFRSRIFCVDFDEQIITDYGMRDYSMSTGQNLSGWERAFESMFKQHIPRHFFYEYRPWTFNRRNLATTDKRTGRESRFLRFVKKVPWVKIDADGVGWFHWPSWNEALHRAYFDGERFLREHQHWRYFDYDWDEDGNWTCHFISDEAKARWDARERRKGRRANGNLSRKVSAAS